MFKPSKKIFYVILVLLLSHFVINGVSAAAKHLETISKEQSFKAESLVAMRECMNAAISFTDKGPSMSKVADFLTYISVAELSLYIIILYVVAACVVRVVSRTNEQHNQ